MTENDRCRFYVAQQYIQATQNLFDGIISTKNPFVNFPKNNNSCNDMTRYSSVSIILPALFCLYQGIELILKGFVLAKIEREDGHDCEALLGQFKIQYKEENELIILFEKFIYSPKEFIKKYMQVNKIKSIREFYESIRYPDKKIRNDGKESLVYREYDSLYHLGINKISGEYSKMKDESLQQVISLKNDVDDLLILGVRLFRKLEDAE